METMETPPTAPAPGRPRHAEGFTCSRRPHLGATPRELSPHCGRHLTSPFFITDWSPTLAGALRQRGEAFLLGPQWWSWDTLAINKSSS